MFLSIGPYSFSLSSPYSPGHCLTAAEAAALNSLRAENIRNTLRRWVELEQRTAGPKGLLSPAQLARLQSKLDSYSENYQFGRLSEGAKPPKGLAEEIILVAEEWLAAQCRQQGAELLDLPNRQELIDEISEKSEVQLEARKRLSARQTVALSVLDELTGGGST